jgi:hypothetical protein
MGGFFLMKGELVLGDEIDRYLPGCWKKIAQTLTSNVWTNERAAKQWTPKSIKSSKRPHRWYLPSTHSIWLRQQAH